MERDCWKVVSCIPTTLQGYEMDKIRQELNQVYEVFNNIFKGLVDWAMTLGNLNYLGRPTNLDKSRARPYCACNKCGWRF